MKYPPHPQKISYKNKKALLLIRSIPMWFVIFFGGGLFGLFAFSQIIWPLFFALPRARRLEREGKLKKSIPFVSFIIAPAVWGFFLLLSIWLVNNNLPELSKTYYWVLIFIFIIITGKIGGNKNLVTDFNDTWGKYLKEEVNTENVKIQSDSDKDILLKVYEMILSSNRLMPAYFTSGNGREKTFGINFEGLLKNDEYEMASHVYNTVENFVKGLENSSQRTWIVRLGEDAMVGAYIITKLGRSDLSYDLEKIVNKGNIDQFRGQSVEVDVDRTYNLEGVKTYIEFCIENGQNLAMGKHIIFPDTFLEEKDKA